MIASGRGGALETVRGLDADWSTGCFFAEQTPTSVLQRSERFEDMLAPVDPEDCRANASRFRSGVFRDHLHDRAIALRRIHSAAQPVERP